MSADTPDRQGLALVGMRGTGKSTVGRILAQRLGRSFIDADVFLERNAGRSIAAIFAEDGERVFRDWEERTLIALTHDYPGAVLATGGGVVLRAANRETLRSFGFIVWLQVEPREAATRLLADRGGLDSRPALTTAGTLDEIAAVLQSRTPLYQATAHAAVETTGRTVEDVADSILALWGLRD